MIVRLQFSKRGPIRFISHRDVARVWERAFRRAKLPLAFSQGFSPHPKVSFGLALPLGYESDAEYLDVTLASPRGPADVAASLNAILPVGMAVEAAAEVAREAASVASQVQWADYLVALSEPDAGPDLSAADFTSALARLEAQPEWIVPRRRKGVEIPGGTEDIRSRVAWLRVLDSAPAPFAPLAFSVRLATQPRVVRPDEVCEVISVAHPCEARLVRRTAQLFAVEGRLADPMVASDVTTAPHEEGPPLHAPIPTPSR